MDIKRFVFGGKAILTLESKKTGTHFTYKITRAKTGDMYFVSLLVGPDNYEDYRYLGFIFPDCSKLYWSPKSVGSIEASSFKAFQFFMERLYTTLPEQLVVHHEGRCGRCGSRLTTPESVESGFGPECRRYIYG